MESFLNFIIVVLILNAIVFYNSGPNHLHLSNHRKKVPHCLFWCFPNRTRILCDKILQHFFNVFKIPN